MSVIIFGFIFVLELLAYCLGFVILFNEKIHNISLGIALMIIFGGGYFLLNLKFGYVLYISFAVAVILLVVFRASTLEKMWKLFKGFFIMTCLEEAIEAVLHLGLQITKQNDISSQSAFLIGNGLMILTWGVVARIKSKKRKINPKYTSLLVTIALAIMAATLIGIIGSLQYAEYYISDRKFLEVSGILAALAYLGMLVLGLFVIYVKDANENYRKMLDAEVQIRMAQKDNYELMLSKENETREFRHDIVNHIICLREMISSSRMEEANQYIEQLQEGLAQIQMKGYSTGNIIVDAILNYYLSSLESGVEVKVTGLCAGNLAISNIELCSVVSNSIQNAIEALAQQTGGDKFLRIQMNTTAQTFIMKISNSFSGETKRMSGGLLKTSKEDEKNHGIGLKHMMQLIEKNHGVLNIETQKGEFQVTFTIPKLNENWKTDR